MSFKVSLIVNNKVYVEGQNDESSVSKFKKCQVEVQFGLWEMQNKWW